LCSARKVSIWYFDYREKEAGQALFWWKIVEEISPGRDLMFGWVTRIIIKMLSTLAKRLIALLLPYCSDSGKIVDGNVSDRESR
jgi:hypothetical protein